MTHTVHPYAHRIGIIRDWKSRWFGSKKSYPEYLRSDVVIREHLEKKLRGLYVSSVDIERSEKVLRVIVKTSRPGLIIGRNGEEIQKLKTSLIKALRKAESNIPEEVRIDVEEIKSPESDAGIVAEMVREGLERRLPFRRVLKQTADKVMANRNVLGVRIRVAGRLGGADMARTEEIMKGRVPLQTFRSDIDFTETRAGIAQGTLGIKVWIYRGEVFEEDKESSR
ncbi:MAG: 30S ribosomal protein S3 [Candidatus Campbellbacteria bacterium]|nr:30S ribosomal protein S3 [Candidatus Campbellbacteria bacterium]